MPDQSLQPVPPGAGRPAGPLGVDDASSQALAEALGSSFALVRLAMALLGIALVLSCVFTVNPNEVAVVLRFGQPRGLGAEAVLKQGLHWALPYPIDEIVRIPVGQSMSLRATNAWFAVTPEDDAAGKTPAASGRLTPGVDGAAITADGNLLHVRATVKYRIVDPVTYAFHFYEATNLLSDAVNNAIFWTAARFRADEALYRDRLAFNEALRARVTEVVDRAGLGVTLEPLSVEVSAPLFVKPAFDEVIQAEQDRSKAISQAQAYFDETVRRAEGEAAALRSAGMVASNALVQAVAAEARFFTNELVNYRRDPALYVTRKRDEAFTQALTNADYRYFLPNRPDGQAREVRISVNPEPPKARKSDAPSGR